MTDTYRIKALKWVRECQILSARTIGACYFVFENRELGLHRAKCVIHSIDTWFPGGYESLDAAKSACEKHWHDTIKQALEEI